MTKIDTTYADAHLAPGAGEKLASILPWLDAIRRKEYHVLCCKGRLATAEKELQLLQLHHINFPSPIGALA